CHIYDLLLVVHSVITVDIGRVFAARRFGEGRTCFDPLLDRRIEAGIARGPLYLHVVNDTIGAQVYPVLYCGVGAALTWRHVENHAWPYAGAYLRCIAAIAARTA